jgi:hypothetical protein
MDGHGLVFAESGELRFGLFLDPVFHRSFFADKDTNKRGKSQKNFELFRARVFSSFQLKDTNKRAKNQKNFEVIRAGVFSSMRLRGAN